MCFLLSGTMKTTVCVMLVLTLCVVSSTPMLETWKCADPKPPDHGFIDGSDFSLGASVHIKCDDGYYLVGSAVMTCVAVPDPWHKQVIWDPSGPRQCLPRTRIERENELSYKGLDEQVVSLDDYAPKYGQYGAVPFPDTKISVGPEGIDEMCTLPMVIGSCRAAFPRYYYNAVEEECQKFTYGGCDGNSNNFQTIEDCERSCMPKDG